MRFTDSRALNGPNILILRHTGHRRKYPNVGFRPCILAVDIEDRQDETGKLGRYVYERKKVGDLTNFFLWPAKKIRGSGVQERPIPGWSEAWSAIIDIDEPDGLTLSRSKSLPRCSIQPDRDSNGTAFPIIISAGTKQTATIPPKTLKVTILNPDKRFEGLKLAYPAGIKSLPRGQEGIVLSDSDENEQKGIFFPIGMKLIAVNAAGDRNNGSLVFDTTKDYRIDEDRSAPLQSMMWVIKKPDPNKVKSDFGTTNLIAWNIGIEGCHVVGPEERTIGGALIDSPLRSTDPDARVITMLSRVHSGPFTTGLISSNPNILKDKHTIGLDGENGDPLKARFIYSQHISTNAYFYKESGDKGGECVLPIEKDAEPLDAPIDFEGPLRVKVTTGPFNKRVHLELWERMPDTFEVGTGVNTGVVIPGECIRHPFLNEERTGLWKMRAESDTEQGEDGGESEPGGPPAEGGE